MTISFSTCCIVIKFSSHRCRWKLVAILAWSWICWWGSHIVICYDFSRRGTEIWSLLASKTSRPRSASRSASNCFETFGRAFGAFCLPLQSIGSWWCFCGVFLFGTCSLKYPCLMSYFFSTFSNCREKDGSDSAKSRLAFCSTFPSCELRTWFPLSFRICAWPLKMSKRTRLLSNQRPFKLAAMTFKSL